MQTLFKQLIVILALLWCGMAFAHEANVTSMPQSQGYQYDIAAQALECDAPMECVSEERAAHVYGQPLPCAALTVLLAGIVLKALKHHRARRHAERELAVGELWNAILNGFSIFFSYCVILFQSMTPRANLRADYCLELRC